MIKSLKKTMTSVLTDISIEWLYPETKEILLSPVGATCLFPGDRLIGYSVVCDTSKYHTNPKSVSILRINYVQIHSLFDTISFPFMYQDKRRRYSMMRSNESTSSVFYHSQEEDAGKVSSESQGSHRENQVSSLFDSFHDTMSESSPVATEQDGMGIAQLGTGCNCR